MIKKNSKAGKIIEADIAAAWRQIDRMLQDVNQKSDRIKTLIKLRKLPAYHDDVPTKDWEAILNAFYAISALQSLYRNF